ncbi:unnamed protein product [Eretmochelys imbricata]
MAQILNTPMSPQQQPFRARCVPWFQQAALERRRSSLRIWKQSQRRIILGRLWKDTEPCLFILKCAPFCPARLHCSMRCRPASQLSHCNSSCRIWFYCTSNSTCAKIWTDTGFSWFDSCLTDSSTWPLVAMQRLPREIIGAGTRGAVVPPGLKWFPSYAGFTVWWDGSQHPPLYKLFQPPCVKSSLRNISARNDLLALISQGFTALSFS